MTLEVRNPLPARADPTFRFTRVVGPGQVPAPDPRVVDLAILDMNYGLPNLGHDSLVHSVGAIHREIRPLLEAAGLALRVVSFEVRASGSVPAPGRFRLLLGTGGPGHIDPHLNDGQAPWCQGVREDPRWEAQAHRLFRSVLEDPDTALLGVCHTFGVLCRWLGVATPTLRGPEKGGKSRGVQQVRLSPEGLEHPWFQRFQGQIQDGRDMSVMDSRLFDLIPNGTPLGAGMSFMAWETLPDGREGDALTMLEIARDRATPMPRFLAVNSHPEIFDPGMQQELVNERIIAGNVSEEWREERRQVILNLRNPAVEWRIRLTSRVVLLDPLRFWVYRLVRQRHEALTGPSPVHEEEVLRAVEGGTGG